ncbi:PRC-barrel domain-containing protein [Streptomyces pathocidini]|uniref:PRC-barrel domain-containing protein n=1 Tax=Streptomyces pathocidini TaxID=1650571 RepID=UPI0033EFAAD0
MLFSELTGRPVMTVAEAKRAGVVDGFVVDPARATVVALRLQKTPDSKRNLLSLSRIRAIGPDAVMVPDTESLRTAEEALAEQAELAGKGLDLPDKPVLTERGEETGTVDDAHFDPETGALHALVTTEGEIPGRAMIGLGTYAVVVRAGPESHPVTP